MYTWKKTKIPGKFPSLTCTHTHTNHWDSRNIISVSTQLHFWHWSLLWNWRHTMMFNLHIQNFSFLFQRGDTSNCWSIFCVLLSHKRIILNSRWRWCREAEVAKSQILNLSFMLSSNPEKQKDRITSFLQQCYALWISVLLQIYQMQWCKPQSLKFDSSQWHISKLREFSFSKHPHDLTCMMCSYHLGP